MLVREYAPSLGKFYHVARCWPKVLLITGYTNAPTLIVHTYTRIYICIIFWNCIYKSYWLDIPPNDMHKSNREYINAMCISTFLDAFKCKRPFQFIWNIYLAETRRPTVRHFDSKHNKYSFHFNININSDNQYAFHWIGVKKKKIIQTNKQKMSKWHNDRFNLNDPITNAQITIYIFRIYLYIGIYLTTKCTSMRCGTESIRP